MLRNDAKRTNRHPGRVEAGGAGYASTPDFVPGFVLQYKPVIESGRLVGGHNPVEFVRHNRPDLIAWPAHFVGIDNERGRVQVERLLTATT